MNAPSDLELRLEAHFVSEAPARAPDRVLATVVRYVQTTPQQRRAFRVPWRYSTMLGTLKLAFGAAVLALVLISGGLLLTPRGANVGSVNPPSPSPSRSAVPLESPAPSPIDTTSWKPFTSTRYGYSMKYPADWTVSFGTAPAAPGDTGDFHLPTVDEFDTTGGVGWTVTSNPQPAGVTESDWLASYGAGGGSNGLPAECWPTLEQQWEAIVIDGHPAHVHGGFASCDFTEAIAFVGGRLYAMGGSPNTFNHPFDRALFDAFLSTVTFDPAAADDTPAVSPSSGQPSANPAAT